MGIGEGIIWAALICVFGPIAAIILIALFAVGCAVIGVLNDTRKDRRRKRLLERTRNEP